MIQIKTVITTAAEQEIVFEKFNFGGKKDSVYVWVRNLGDTDIYMSDTSGIVAEADNVILLKAGQMGLVTTVLDNKIYTLGETTLECHAQLFAECPFRGAASGGGGGGGQGGIHFLGTTTTALTDGASTNPITINGEPVEAQNGDIAIYSHQEFIFDGLYWSEFGDMSGLGDLAFKDSASGSFTPAGSISTPTFTGNLMPVQVSGTPTGTISTPTFTGTQGSVNISVTPTTGSVTGITAVGTLPVFSYDSATENLSYTPGTLPTADTAKTFMTGATATGTYTPEGTVSTPTFTGSTLTSNGDITPAGTISTPTFTGTADTVTVS